MHKPLRTLLLASLLCLPGALFARTVAPFASAQEKNIFATWTPNQLTQATDINLTIFLPIEGTHNWWNLEFRSAETGITTTFTTDSNTASSNQLGSLPEGRYDLFYSTIYGPNATFDVRLDFYDGSRNGSAYPNGNYGAVYGLTVGEESNVLIIDKDDF
jgi:hypothetical protein